MPGLTSLLGIQELTCTVADLDQATTFLTSVFGAESIGDGGEFRDQHRMSVCSKPSIRANARSGR